MPQPFDAVLVVAFGGPVGPADVRPFLGNVLRGRRVAPERIEEVAHHYDLFDGVSPLTALTRAQADALGRVLADRGRPLPVYVGMRNWHPYLAETLGEMARAGVRRAIGVLAAAHRSYSSCTQYRENVRDARAALRASALPDVEVTFLPDWHTDAGFIEAAADEVVAAMEAWPASLSARATIVFTAHSIPESMAARYPYREQYEASAALVASRVRARTSLPLPHEAVYQSRSGRPEDPWLGPDVGEFLRAARARGMEAAVLSPLGFISDHVEVLYDLDVEAAGICREIGLPMVRARSVNDHPAFIGTLADAVLRTYGQYERGRPLPIAMPLPR